MGTGEHNEMVQNKINRYDGLNGVRAYAILGIVIMHVLLNGNFNMDSWVFSSLIPKFGNFVFVFMVISGFGMCCGYYDKVKENSISNKEFYGRRYKKIWPFFALVCLIDVIMSPSINSVYELIANMTLCQGLLPNPQISVIGVSWTLGVIFVFYMLFPFYCYLIDNKKKAVLVIAIAFIFNILCKQYFFDADHMLSGYDSRQNIIYCAVYFLIGGGVYLYRELFEKRGKIGNAVVLISTVLSLIAFAVFIPNTVILVFMSSTVLIYAIGVGGVGLLKNPFTQFISGISFEIYLCHMMVYRLVEKLNLVHILGDGLAAYIFTSAITIGGAVAFSLIVRIGLKTIDEFIKKRCN